jgi:hypothetical protein
MGTEVFVFFLSAFDRPFDKTAIGMDLPTHLDGEEDDENGNSESQEGEHAEGVVVKGAPVGGTIIIGGGAVAANGATGATAATGTVATGAAVTGAAASSGPVVEGTGAAGAAGAAVIAAPSWVEAQQQVSPELAEAQSRYVEELKKLTETLQKVSEQSERLTRDSEEMENLNRTLTGICKVYEMQLKSASQQIGTIDQINDQSRHMAQQIEQLNSIYARMIEAMTVNMKGVSNA